MSEERPPEPPECEQSAQASTSADEPAPANASPFAVPEGDRLLEGDYDRLVDAGASPFRLPEGGGRPEG